ncbi:unnamed protein product [Adineta ricciae]|uniref:Uncharacterized protein n=1 Tax=Adineta ricciae TaxID=249248 RepID=A0A815VYR6_ADIRI|nr:unnamed protein product [Adineta ricciae]
MATITVSTEIICPNCGKRMIKKNWKDHARCKHAMTEENIQTKYEQLIPSSSNKPIPIAMHNFFSTKKFATMPAVEKQTLDDNSCTTDTMLVDHEDNDMTASKNYSMSKDSDTLYQNEDLSTFATDECNANKSNEHETMNNQNDEMIVEDNDCLLELNLNMVSNTEHQNSHYQSPTSLKTSVTTTSNLSKCHYANRANYPDIEWNPHRSLSSTKPSPTWFSDDYPWLRAIYSNGFYGLICADCVEFASSEVAIKKNNGAFVVRPYWKLKHKGLEGIKEHKKMKCSVVGQLHCVNLDTQTRKYLAILVQTLWKIIREEMALSKFKPLIEFLHQVHCPDIVDWFKISNISSIKKARFINLIMDETRDITVKQMFCLCLRYVEDDTGQIHEDTFTLKQINDTSGKGVFKVAQEFIDQLQKDTGKELIITAQTYDGAASMRFQAQGHVRSRLSAWGMYIYCRSHLLNLSVEDAIENAMFDAYDTVHSTLVFLRDSPHRLQILFESQKLILPSTKEQTIPQPSDTRWSYAYEIIQFMCKHYTAVIITLSTISQQKGTGSSDGRRYALDLIKPDVIFQVYLIRDALRPSLNFLRQIEKRGACLDDFATHVEAARSTIKQSIEMFDFNQIQTILHEIRQYLPVIQPTFRSTRTQNQASSTDFNEEELRIIGNEFIVHFLQSLDTRFNREAKELIENIQLLSSPFKCSATQLLQNPLIIQYCSPTTYKHIGVDKKTYERTDPPLLNFQELKNDVFAFLTIVDDLTSIGVITQHLAQYGSEQCSEWYKLYQILATFAIGSNEAERTFSTLRRTKTYLRNSLNNETLEILIKLSSLKPDLTDAAVKFIIDDFISHPQRAKHRNQQQHLVTIFYYGDTSTDRESKRSAHLTRLAANLIISILLPLSLVENPQLQLVFQEAEPSYILSKRKSFIGNVLNQMYDETRNRVQNELNCATSVCLTTDIWTPQSNEAYMTVTVHFVDTSNSKLKSFVLETTEFSGNHTAQQIVERLENICIDWPILDKVVCLVSDTCNVMRNLGNDFAKVELVLFTNHLLDLCVNDVIRKRDDVKNVLSTVRHIVFFVRNSHLAYETLNKYQRSLDLNERHLIYNVLARWNSTYYMLQRFIDDKLSISACLNEKAFQKNLTTAKISRNSDWDLQEQLMMVLEPFEAATRKLSVEFCPSISLVLPVITSAVSHSGRSSLEKF